MSDGDGDGDRDRDRDNDGSEPTGASPRPSLRQATLDQALRARPERRSRRSPESAISTIAAFHEEHAAFDALLADLGDGDWARITPQGWTVHQLLAHLVGVGRYLAKGMGLDPGYTVDEAAEHAHDHVAISYPAMAEHRCVAPRITRDACRVTWRAIEDWLAARVTLPVELAYYDSVRSTDLVLRLRAFELWAHGDNIRSVTGRPLHVPSEGALHLLCELAAHAVPAVMPVVDPCTIRLVLTGRGGGTFLLPLAGGGAETLVVTEALGFCQVASLNKAVDEQSYDLEGDVTLGSALFEAARSLTQ